MATMKISQVYNVNCGFFSLLKDIKYIIIRCLIHLVVACEFINMKQYVIHNNKITNFMRDKFELS